MNKQFKKPAVLFACSLFALKAVAQDSAAKKVEMADRMRADGKIYVVIVVVLVILIGLIGYVTNLDRKINRLEKEIK
jgi:CcmD family protein